MNTLKIDDGMDGQTITYSERLANGIYIVTDRSIAEHNCELLRITIGRPDSENSMLNTISKFGNAGILTLTGQDDMHQFIFLQQATEADLQSVLKTIPPSGHIFFRRTYEISKPMFLNDIDRSSLN